MTDMKELNIIFNVDYMFDEEYCFNKFKSLKIETIENILNLFNIKKDPTLRTLLEIIDT